jgi:hypothetical protein
MRDFRSISGSPHRPWDHIRKPVPTKDRQLPKNTASTVAAALSYRPMTTTLLTAGIACVIAAIAGGGLKAFGIEIPALASARRQGALGAFGALLLVAAFVSGGSVPWNTAAGKAGDPSNSTSDDAGAGNCVAAAFNSLPSRRVRSVESGAHDFEVLRASEPKDAPMAIVIEESRQPVGAVEFDYFDDTQIFKIRQVVDGNCQPISAFKNSSRGGDEHVLQNWDTIEITFPDVKYALRLGYSEGSISASLTQVR